MSKAPAMPMYWDAYLADTTHLTTEEHGAYMLLIAAMWRRNGSVPDDDKDNARILGLTPAKWRKIKARFVATISGFSIEGDTITQEKVRKIWKITQEKIAKSAANGAKGGRATASKNKDLAQANATISLQQNSSIPEPYPYNSSKDETDKPSADDFDSAQSAVWAMGPALLSKSGIAKPRPVIGKWLKQSRAEDVLAAITAAISAKTKDPVPYITATLAGRLKEAKIGDLRVLANGQRQRYHGAFDGWMNDYD